MALLNDLTLQAIFSRLFAALLFVAIHGGVLTLLATVLRRDASGPLERFSANPLDHLSLPGMAMAVLFRVTWIRYREIAPDALRGGRLALAGVALATLCISLAVVPLLDLLRPVIATYLPRTAGYAVLQVVVALQELTLASVLLGALPLPGLTGGLFLLALMPHKAAPLQRLVVPVNVILVVALISGLLPNPAPMLAPFFTRL